MILSGCQRNLEIRLQSERRRQKVTFKELKLSNTPEFYAGGWPKQYAKGPDVMSKSKRTQECYRTQNKDQTSLTGRFGFTSTKSAATVNDAVLQPMVTDNQCATPARARRITTTSAQPQPPKTNV